MNKRRVLAVALTLLCATSLAGDFAAGERRAGRCAGCHGPKGLSDDPLVANIACQHEAYLVKAMTEYKTGSRTDPDMQAMMADLSATDIENLATFYASMTCRVRKPKADNDR